MCLALFRGAIQRSCDFSAIVSRLFSPSLSPRLVKSQCASAAPAASESLLRSGEALSPKNQNTHARTHTRSLSSVGQPPRTGGGLLRMTTTARMTATASSKAPFP